MTIESIIALFHREKPVNYTLETIRTGELDSRWVVTVEFENEKYMLKIASNSFTTEERISGWARMIDEFTKLGYYSPAIRESLNGKCVERVTYEGMNCVVWEEEFAKYNLHDSMDKSVHTAADGKHVYHDEVLGFLAKIGQMHYDFFTYPSAWVRFEPSSPDDKKEASMQKYGFWTSTKSKKLLVDVLAKFLREKAGNIPSKEALNECLTYMYDDKGASNAQDGCYDDRVIAMGLAIYYIHKFGSGDMPYVSERLSNLYSINSVTGY